MYVHKWNFSYMELFIHERVPKFGLHEGIHSIGAYPRSKSAVGTLIPGLYMRGNPLCK